MKTLKVLSAAFLMTLSSFSFASDGTKREKFNVNYALKTYIDAAAYGNVEALPEVMHKDIRFTTTINDKLVNHTKSEIIKSFQALEDVKQNCSTEFSVIESTPNLSLVKVIMKYDNFSKITYLNLANTKDGWQITNISVSVI